MKTIQIFCLVMLMVIVPVGATLAYPFCGSNQPPNQESAFCRYDLVMNDVYRLKPGVPFAWLRSAAASDASIVATIQPSNTPSLVTVGGPAHWDGVQWWYEMQTYPVARWRGWVERTSLVQAVIDAGVPVMTPAPVVNDPSIQLPADWTPPFTARVETGTPFLWVREGANEGRIVDTLAAGEQFIVTGQSRFDGYQYWWAVVTNRRNHGWVEQGSITPLR